MNTGPAQPIPTDDDNRPPKPTAVYQLPDALNCPLDRTTQLAELPTRLKRLDERTQERLINWGYAACDAALRKHLQSNLQPKPVFPYPQSGV